MALKAWRAHSEAKMLEQARFSVPILVDGKQAGSRQESGKKPAAPGSVSWQDHLLDGQEVGRHGKDGNGMGMGRHALQVTRFQLVYTNTVSIRHYSSRIFKEIRHAFHCI
jgi:hypothetical protein